MSRTSIRCILAEALSQIKREHGIEIKSLKVFTRTTYPDHPTNYTLAGLTPRAEIKELVYEINAEAKE